jgi:DNA-binding winged helix-turn-helix (wHTH) protein
VHLTPKQFELLHYLMMHAGRPIPHAKLLRSVWGPEYGNELEYLRTFIRQIRMKIEDDPANPQYLITDSHIGYRFNEEQNAGVRVQSAKHGKRAGIDLAGVLSWWAAYIESSGCEEMICKSARKIEGLECER